MTMTSCRDRARGDAAVGSDAGGGNGSGASRRIRVAGGRRRQLQAGAAIGICWPRRRGLGGGSGRHPR